LPFHRGRPSDKELVEILEKAIYENVEGSMPKETAVVALKRFKKSNLIRVLKLHFDDECISYALTLLE